MSVISTASSHHAPQDLTDPGRATLAKQAPLMLDSGNRSGSQNLNAVQDRTMGQVILSGHTLETHRESQTSSVNSRTLAHLSTRSTFDHELADAIMSEGYDAIGDSLAWDQLSTRLAQVFAAEQTFFLTSGAGTNTGYKVIGSSLDNQQATACYLEEVRRFDQQRGRATDRPSPFLAFPYLERVSTFSFDTSDNNSAETSETAEQSHPNGNKRRHCLFPLTNQDNGGLFILVRPMGQGDLANSELDLLQHVLPHLSRAVALHAQTSHLTQKNRYLEETLDSLPQGLALADEEGQLIYSNRYAKACLEEREGLLLNNGQLFAKDPKNNKLLKQNLTVATPADLEDPQPEEQGQDGDSSTFMICERSESHLVVDFAPLFDAQPQKSKASTQQSPAQQSLVRLVLKDSRDSKQPSPESLKRAFNLTPTEAAVALLLGQGKSAEEVASLRKITKETARFYIKAILQKTDCHRQPQLVHKLATLGI
ncbi:LuxR C-terminal-related transcriptional regulator [Rhodovibrionaceae bacterium A322]